MRKDDMKFKKTVSMLVLIAFASTNLVFAAPAQGVSGSFSTQGKSEAGLQTLANQIEIPENLGTIQERYIPAEGSVSTVIHIQDAHSSNDAQASTRAILEHLQKTYGVNQIFLEGAMGEVLPELLLYFKDKRMNEKLADRLQKESLIGGTELFLLDDYYQNRQASVHGIENVSLYKQNLADFRAVMNQKEKTGKFISSLKSKVFSGGSKVFNKELKTFFREWAFYQDAQDEAMRHLETLERGIKTHMNIDLRDPLTQAEWPQLVRVIRLKDLETKIDMEKVKSEREILKAWMGPHEGDFSQLLASVTDSSIKVKDPRKAAEKFLTENAEKSFSFETYPELSKALGRIILKNELQAGVLFNEMHALTAKLLNHLAKTDEEKKVLAEYSDYLTLRKLFSLELTREEYSEALKRREILKPSAMTGSEQKSLDPVFDTAMSFYGIAIERENTMFARMSQTMKETKDSTSVIVTGGFHTEGLAEQMKQNKIAYIEIMPRIGNLKDTNGYMKVMMLDASTANSFVKGNNPADMQAMPEILTATMSVARRLSADAAEPVLRSEVRKSGSETRKNNVRANVGMQGGEQLEDRIYAAADTAANPSAIMGLAIPGQTAASTTLTQNNLSPTVQALTSTVAVQTVQSITIPAVQPAEGISYKELHNAHTASLAGSQNIGISGGRGTVVGLTVNVGYNTSAQQFSGGGVAFNSTPFDGTANHFYVLANLDTPDAKLEMRDSKGNTLNVLLTNIPTRQSQAAAYEIDFSKHPTFNPKEIRTIFLIVEGKAKTGTGSFEMIKLNQLPAVAATQPNEKITETLPIFNLANVDAVGVPEVRASATAAGVTGIFNTTARYDYNGLGFVVKNPAVNGIDLKTTSLKSIQVIVTSDHYIPSGKMEILGPNARYTVQTGAIRPGVPTLITIPVDDKMKAAISRIDGAVFVVDTAYPQGSVSLDFKNISSPAKITKPLYAGPINSENLSFISKLGLSQSAFHETGVNMNYFPNGDFTGITFASPLSLEGKDALELALASSETLPRLKLEIRDGDGPNAKVVTVELEDIRSGRRVHSISADFLRQNGITQIKQIVFVFPTVPNYANLSVDFKEDTAAVINVQASGTDTRNVTVLPAFALDASGNIKHFRVGPGDTANPLTYTSSKSLQAMNAGVDQGMVAPFDNRDTAFQETQDLSKLTAITLAAQTSNPNGQIKVEVIDAAGKKARVMVGGLSPNEFRTFTISTNALKNQGIDLTKVVGISFLNPRDAQNPGRIVTSNIMAYVSPTKFPISFSNEAYRVQVIEDRVYISPIGLDAGKTSFGTLKVIHSTGQVDKNPQIASARFLPPTVNSAYIVELTDASGKKSYFPIRTRVQNQPLNFTASEGIFTPDRKQFFAFEAAGNFNLYETGAFNTIRQFPGSQDAALQPLEKRALVINDTAVVTNIVTTPDGGGRLYVQVYPFNTIFDPKDLTGGIVIPPGASISSYSNAAISLKSPTSATLELVNGKTYTISWTLTPAKITVTESLVAPRALFASHGLDGAKNQDYTFVYGASGTPVYQQFFPKATLDNALAYTDYLILDRSIHTAGGPKVEILFNYLAGNLSTVTLPGAAAASVTRGTDRSLTVRVTASNQREETTYTILDGKIISSKTEPIKTIASAGANPNTITPLRVVTDLYLPGAPVTVRYAAPQNPVTGVVNEGLTLINRDAKGLKFSAAGSDRGVGLEILGGLTDRSLIGLTGKGPIRVELVETQGTGANILTEVKQSVLINLTGTNIYQLKQSDFPAVNFQKVTRINFLNPDETTATYSILSAPLSDAEQKAKRDAAIEAVLNTPAYGGISYQSAKTLAENIFAHLNTANAPYKKEFDLNDDQYVTAIDALSVINFLNERFPKGSAVPVTAAPTVSNGAFYYDTVDAGQNYALYKKDGTVAAKVEKNIQAQGSGTIAVGAYGSPNYLTPDVSADGKYAVLGQIQRSFHTGHDLRKFVITVRDLQTGSKVRDITVEEKDNSPLNPVTSVRFHTNSSKIAELTYAGSPAQVVYYDILTGQKVKLSSAFIGPRQLSEIPAIDLLFERIGTQGLKSAINRAEFREVMVEEGLSLEAVANVYQYVAQKTIPAVLDPETTLKLVKIFEDSGTEQNIKMDQARRILLDVLKGEEGITENATGNKPIHLAVPLPEGITPEQLLPLAGILQNKGDEIYLLMQGPGATEQAAREFDAALDIKIIKIAGESAAQRIHVAAAPDAKTFASQAIRAVGTSKNFLGERGVADWDAVTLGRIGHAGNLNRLLTPSEIKETVIVALLAAAYLRDAKEPSLGVSSLKAWMEQKGIKSEGLSARIAIAAAALAKLASAA